jgi:hypothetical protein
MTIVSKHRCTLLSVTDNKTLLAHSPATRLTLLPNRPPGGGGGACRLTRRGGATIPTSAAAVDDDVLTASRSTPFPRLIPLATDVLNGRWFASFDCSSSCQVVIGLSCALSRDEAPPYVAYIVCGTSNPST